MHRARVLDSQKTGLYSRLGQWVTPATFCIYCILALNTSTSQGWKKLVSFISFILIKISISDNFFLILTFGVPLYCNIDLVHFLLHSEMQKLKHKRKQINGLKSLTKMFKFKVKQNYFAFIFIYLHLCFYKSNIETIDQY